MRFCSGKAGEFYNYYILRLNYVEDGYYVTYNYRKQFAEEVKKIEQRNQAKVLGGDIFPKQSTILIFNCNERQIVQKLAKTCIYSTKNYVKDFTIEEVNKISTEKFLKIWYFYQPKLK